MADFRAKIETARKAGYSDAEIKGFLFSQPEAEKAREAGYTDEEISKHFGLEEKPTGFADTTSGKVLGYLNEAAGNAPADIMNIAQGAYNVATDPLQALQGVAEAVGSPLQTAAQLAGGAYQVARHPFESFKQAPVSTLLGATAARGIVSPLTAGLSNVGAAATPIVRNMMNPKAQMYGEAFGAQMPEAINALASARPGLTTTQALADINAPGAQAIGEKAIQRVPQEALAAQQAQETARAQRIGQIAGTPEDLAAAEQARATAAKVNYASAFQEAAPAIPEELLNRPSMKKAFQVAEDLAAERGGKSTPMQALHDTKLALDKIVASPKDYGLEGAQKVAIQDTRKAFISELEKNTAYSKARSEYAAQSVPINKMQIAQELQKALTSPLTGETTRGAMFAKAAEEAPKTIKRATGQEFYSKLEDVLSPDEMKVVNDVRDEFRRTQLAKDQAKLAKASGEDLLSSQYKVPNWLNPIWTFANTIVKRSLGKIDEKLAIQIGMESLEPAQMQKALKAAQEYNAKTQVMQQRARRKPVTPPIISGAVSFGNALAPQQNQNAMAR
jgi:hypothetical protein